MRCCQNAGNDFTHVEWLAGIRGDHAVQLLGIKPRRLRGAQSQINGLFAVQIADRLTRQGQGVTIVLRQMVGHARETCVDVATAQVLSGDHLSCGGLDQGWPPQKNGALVFHDDGLIAHGWHIRPSCRAGAHDHSNLCNPLRTHVGLVKKDASEVLAIWKHLVLIGQIRPP
jgi:hypothetical protein